MARRRLKMSYRRRKAIDMGRISKTRRRKGQRISKGDRGRRYSSRY